MHEIVAAVAVVVFVSYAETVAIAGVAGGMIENAAAVVVIAVAGALCLWLFSYRDCVGLVYLRDIDWFFCNVAVGCGFGCARRRGGE